MKLERLRLSSSFLADLGFMGFFEFVDSIKILTTFQYDRNNFLSLERIHFKREHVSDWELILKEHFPVEFIQLISRRGDDILCVIKSTSETGFFPMPGNITGPWALLPPISIDKDSIMITIFSNEEVLCLIHDALSSMGAVFTILSLSDASESMVGDSWGGMMGPSFTGRQEEIARYAVRHGFFKTPKEISAIDIGGYFGISVSAVNEHLRKVKRLSMEYFFG
ncbi:MAG: helix-turn-helix domain-containing protein [Promethearchaeota archaeon]